MNHENAQICLGREETVHRFLDGELSPAEREEFTEAPDELSGLSGAAGRGGGPIFNADGLAG